jgi:predicted RNase H-like HicB family nuclease
MLLKFMQAALKKAHYEILENEGFYGEIPGFDGVYAQADNLEECREELSSILEEWIFIRLSRNLPIPPVDGIELKVQHVA